MTAFTGFAFKADASQAAQLARTMPDRLSDIVNVKDFGAVGNGLTNDQPAITAALAYAFSRGTSNGGGAAIFFPAGTYFIASPPLILNPVIHGPWCRFYGAGRDESIIRGTSTANGNQPNNQYNANFLCLVRCNDISTTPDVCGFSDMTFWNDNQAAASGALHFDFVGSPAIQLQRCHFHGMIGLHLQTFSVSNLVEDCIATCSKPISAASAASRSPMDPVNLINALPSGGVTCSVGFAVETGVNIGNYAEGFDVGFAAGGATQSISLVFLGNKASRCGVGFAPVFLGSPTDSNDVTLATPSAFNGGSTNFYASNTSDRCIWGALTKSTRTNRFANIFTGKRSGASSIAGPYDPATINNMVSGGGGTVTVTTQVAHNFSAGAVIQLAVQASGPNPWTTDPYGIVTVATASGSTFTYAGPVSPVPSSFVAGSWNYPPQHGHIIWYSYQSVSGASWMDNMEMSREGIYFNHPTYSSSDGYDFSQVWAERPLTGWKAGTSDNLGRFDYIACGMAGANKNPSQFLTMNSLPTTTASTGGRETVLEGQEANVIDAQTTAIGGIVPVTGGGSGHYKIRYNGTNWIRIG